MKFILSIFICLICPITISKYIPKNGDLLFQDIDCGPLCEAIEQVTTGIDGARFSHVGILVKTDTGLYVLEAISAGVVYTPYTEFLSRSKDAEGHPKVLVGRLKDKYQSLIPGAMYTMQKYRDKPYDTVFSMTNDAYYCSELIYLGFTSAANDSSFFKLSPMTFKTTGSDTYFPVWKDYFNKMNVEIPEGKPGLNPGGISLSDKIEIVYEFGKPDGYKP